jgi:hypothetical protein
MNLKLNKFALAYQVIVLFIYTAMSPIYFYFHINY